MIKMPVIIPPDGTFSDWYKSCPANCDNSRKGVHGSTSKLIRSRGNSLFRDLCFVMAAGPPPSSTVLTKFLGELFKWANN